MSEIWEDMIGFAPRYRIDSVSIMDAGYLSGLASSRVFPMRGNAAYMLFETIEDASMAALAL